MGASHVSGRMDCLWGGREMSKHLDFMVLILKLLRWLNTSSSWSWLLAFRTLARCSFANMYRDWEQPRQVPLDMITQWKRSPFTLILVLREEYSSIILFVKTASKAIWITVAIRKPQSRRSNDFSASKDNRQRDCLCFLEIIYGGDGLCFCALHGGANRTVLCRLYLMRSIIWL